MVPERVRKQQNHGDHETVNGRRFDHGQPHKQCTGDGVLFIGLLSDGAQSLRHGAPFTERGPMEPTAMVMPAVMMEAMPMRLTLSI
jgi:hypothetical protein